MQGKQGQKGGDVKPLFLGRLVAVRCDLLPYAHDKFKEDRIFRSLPINTANLEIRKNIRKEKHGKSSWWGKSKKMKERNGALLQLSVLWKGDAKTSKRKKEMQWQPYSFKNNKGRTNTSLCLLIDYQGKTPRKIFNMFLACCSALTLILSQLWRKRGRD